MRHMGIRQQPAAQPGSNQEQHEKVAKTEASKAVKIEAAEAAQTKAPPAASKGSRKRKAVVPAVELQTVGANTQSHPCKKPRVRAHIIKEEYLKKH